MKVNMKKYHVNEIFLSIQGEGQRSGIANVLVRFAHCNLKCNLAEHGFDCDTDYSGSIEYTKQGLIEKIEEVGGICPNIIFTGGEPALQLDFDLTRDLWEKHYFLAVETNGTHNLDKLTLDWVSCSPKTAEHTIRLSKCHELRYVLADGRALPKPSIQADHYYLSPVFNPDWTVDQKSLAWCIKLIMENPKWKLSVQWHKMLHLR